MFIEILKFVLYAGLIVILSKYALVPCLRKLAQNLRLKPKMVGNIAGIATSVPELLTVCFSAATGFLSTSIYNILSSNIINVIQYSISVILHQNQKVLKNPALRLDLILVLVTIFIPVFLLVLPIQLDISIVPIFFLLFLLFYFMNHNAHKVYLKFIEEKKHEIQNRNRKSLFPSIIALITTSIILFFIGDLLSGTLENLSNLFSIPESILGIALGFITSIPELITFFESQKHYKTKQQEELGVVEATNNLLTSNMLNLFFIQSMGILIFAFFA